MSDVPPSTPKNRRELLGLLAGATLLGSAAKAEPQAAKSQAAQGAKPAPAAKPAKLITLKAKTFNGKVFIIGDDGHTPASCDGQHLNKKANQVLVVANFHKKTYTFFFPKDANPVHGSPFDDDCIPVPGGSVVQLSLRSDCPGSTDFKWCTMAGEVSPCPADCPQNDDDSGDIIVD